MAALIQNETQDGWRTCKIGEVTQRTGHRNPGAEPKKHFTYIDVSAVSNTSFRITAPAEILGAEAPSRARKVVHSGDVLFATVRPTLKRVALVPERLHDQIASTGYIVLRADSAKLDSGYLYFRLLTDEFTTRMREVERGVSYPAVRDTDVLKEEISLPPLPEQKKIAGVLGLVRRAMEQQERLIEKTAELKKTLLHQLFTQGTRGEPQKQTDLGPIPESWDLVEIGSLGKIVTGSTPKTAEPANYSPAEIDFIAPADLGIAKDVTDSEKKISRQGLASIRALPSKAVLCVCIGSSIGKVGMTIKESATNQQINSIVCNERHDPDFIFHQLIYRYDYWRGFATFGTVPILNKGRFQTIKLSIPKARTEEVEIAAALNALEAKLAHHRRKHATLSALFRTLLHQLMTAQLRVHDLELDGILEQAVQETDAP
jgi:type I restriction enzyme S subunit